MTSRIENPHLGTAFDDFLAEDGLLESANRTAQLRMSVWQEERKSLWQVAQSGYDVFVVQDDGPLVRATDENAGALGVARKVQEKVSKAQNYDNKRDLILAVYLNEPILSQYFTRELQEFIREHQAFRRIDPFVRIVFSGIGEGVVYP